MRRHQEDTCHLHVCVPGLEHDDGEGVPEDAQAPNYGDQHSLDDNFEAFITMPKNMCAFD